MGDSKSSGTELVKDCWSPESGQNFAKLKTLLREMFQLDRGDLDFGLYRIMKMKGAEIEEFLDGELLPQVKEILAGGTDEELVQIEKKLQETIQQLTKLKAPIEDNETVLDLRDQLAKKQVEVDIETDVYGHLANFFARYYDEGDFMSLRRYSGSGRSAYLIPYDGEEVKLHWANADQFYIKTTENYATYAFNVGDDNEGAFRVRFEIGAADSTKDNIKESKDSQRRFVLLDEPQSVALDGNEIVVRFEHRPLTEAEKRSWTGNGARQQRRVNESTTRRVLDAVDKLAPEKYPPLAAPAPAEGSPDRTLLAKHIERYTSKNSFDYFIHKNLDGFLERELDFYLKNEVLKLDDLELGDSDRLRRALARTRAIRGVAGKIIAFLAQLENFQKRLWLKRKFVLESQWCVTLDRVPEELYPEVAANVAQREEWVELCAIDEIAGDLGNGGVGYSAPLKTEFLKANPYLVVDTRHYAAEFKDRLLAALSEEGPLDDQCNGLLVHGENFQALNLLKTRYRGQIQCVYVDPPYNTDSSPILYKNDLKDSSWLSLMEDRLLLAKTLLVEQGIVSCAIDDEEVSHVRALLRNIFDKEIGIAPVRSTPIGRTSRGKLSPTHEYALFYGGRRAAPASLEKTDKEKKRYPHSDECGRYAWRNLLRTGTNDLRIDRPKLFYPIFVDRNNDLRVPQMEWDEQKEEYRILENLREDETVVWPIKMQDGRRIEKNWERGWERVSRESRETNQYRIQRNGNVSGQQEISIHFIQRMDPSSVPKTWWGDPKYASSNHGAKVLKNLFGEAPFDFAKSVGLVEDCIRASGGSDHGAQVVDIFGGSGTTGHAVINLNREDGGLRKYLVVEMAYYFDSVLLPRIKKVVYASDWQGGKPVSRQDGITQLIKYIRLESYEDTLDGLRLSPANGDLLQRDPTLAEDYHLRYGLGVETSGSACLLGTHFADPFSYTLSVVRDGTRRETPVDLPETFTYLLGLSVKSRQLVSGVLAITGKDTTGQSCLVLWRNVETTDNEALEDWFASNRWRFPKSLNLIYVNGDHTLNAIRQSEETWVAETIEPFFRELMFEPSER